MTQHDTTRQQASWHLNEAGDLRWQSHKAISSDTLPAPRQTPLHLFRQARQEDTLLGSSGCGGRAHARGLGGPLAARALLLAVLLVDRATEAWGWRAVAAILLGATTDHARVHGARHAVVVLAVDLGEHIPDGAEEHGWTGGHA